MVRPRSLTLEPLEDRTTPSVYGIPWLDPGRLTLSFAPDGTQIVGHTSDLFATLNATLDTPVWQREILRAFQTWATQANLNVSVKADGGQPFGSPGQLQHDPRFGDIRVGAHPMSLDVLAVSVPHDPFLLNTLAGDVFLNSAYTFSGSNLFPILLHEAGHVLGLEHSSDADSVMYSHFNDRTALTAGDVDALRALYGARAPDLHEGHTGNETFGTAARIRHPARPRGPYNGSTPLVLFGDITAATDVDMYSVQPPNNYSGPVTFRVQTAGISALAPRLTVYNAAGQALGEASSTDPFGAVLSVTLPSVQRNATYYAKAQSASGDIFGIGGYGLAVTFNANLLTSLTALDQVLRSPYETLSAEEIDSLFLDPTHTFFNDDHHTNDTFSRATPLNPRPGLGINPNQEYLASLSDATDVDFYRLNLNPAHYGEVSVMTVSLWGISSNGVLPRAAIYQANHDPVPAQVLVNGNGTYTIQAPLSHPGGVYYLRVFAPAQAEDRVGNYSLRIYFGNREAELTTFAAGTLSSTTPEQYGTLYVARSQLFQFVLSADAFGVPADARVNMTIYDSQGAEVFRLVAGVGGPVSGPSLFLTPGAYTVRFSVQSPSGGAIPPLRFLLRGAGLSDPIGPVLDDPTLLPMYTSSTDPTLYEYPGDFLLLSTYLWILLL